MLPRPTPPRPLRFVEVGAGIGTMLERLVERKALGSAEYIVLEADGGHREAAARRHEAWAARHGRTWARPAADRWRIEGPGLAIDVDWRTGSLFDEIKPVTADVALAHAFLDLVDLDRALPRLLSLVGAGGLFYFTLNFDGTTAFLPEVDPAFDNAVIEAYHATMDERRDGGYPSGSSRTGRRLLAELPRHGAAVIDAGSSDWVIVPRQRAYPPDEAIVLQALLDMIHDSVARRGNLDAPRFSEWIETRRRQVAAGELIFLAHQIDVLGRKG